MVKAKKNVQTTGDEESHDNMEFEASKGLNVENPAEGQKDNQKVAYEEGQSSGTGDVAIPQLMQQMAEAISNPQTKGANDFICMMKKVLGVNTEILQRKNEGTFEQPQYNQVHHNPVYESRKGKEIIHIDQEVSCVGSKIENGKPIMPNIPMFQTVPNSKYQPPWKSNVMNTSNHMQEIPYLVGNPQGGQYPGPNYNRPNTPFPLGNQGNHQAYNTQHIRPDVGNFQNIQPENINNDYMRNFIMECMREMYGQVPRRNDRPLLRSPYAQRIEEITLPRNIKAPKLDLFSGEDHQSTLEHVGRFFLQIGDLANDPVYKMKLFPTSLTKSAFTWFINLAPNSINTWQELENQFHTQFF